jgi:transposase
MGKFKLDKRSQGNLLGYYAEDFLPEGHLAYVVDEIVKHLDTQEIEDKYSDIGQNSYHPKIMIKIIFYGYTIGIFSSRKLANACEQDVAFIYLASSNKPDFRTISDFRKDNLEGLNEYFVEVLKYCELIGLRTAEKIGIDGSKSRANASSRRSKDIEGYERWERNIREQIKKLQSKGIEKDEIEDRIYQEVEEEKVPKQIRKKEALLEKIAEAKKELKEMEKVRRKGKKEKAVKLNLTDKDAKFMKERMGVTRANYNAQIALSEDQIIVAAEVVKDAGDRKQLGPMIEQAEKSTGKRIEEVYADAGFSSYENYKYIDNKSIEPIYQIKNTIKLNT